jgi:hypothetical protein
MPLDINVTGSDPEGEPLTFVVAAQPAHGMVTGAPPTYTYTPVSNYHGPDSFTITANDGTSDSTHATIAVAVAAVNDAPEAMSTMAGAACNAPAAVILSGFDADGDALSYTVTTPPAHGALSGPAPTLTYTPEEGYAGADRLDFTVSDGTLESGRATVYFWVGACAGGLPLPFSDDFESDLGWQVNPGATDSASRGAWARGAAELTHEAGLKQLAPASGSFDLATGPSAGSDASRNDLDGGRTSVRSPDIQLPAGQEVMISFNYTFAHGNSASDADYLRVQVVGSAGAQTVLEVRGASQDLDASWQPVSERLSELAGQTVYLLIEAADQGRASLVEAAIDDLSITTGTAVGSSPDATLVVERRADRSDVQR